MPGALPRRASACLVGGEEALGVLLSEVLQEMGVTLLAEGAGRGPPPDVVLVLMQHGAANLELLEQARRAGHPAPVLALLPFDDATLSRLALRAGAWGCFALGRPLAELCSTLRAALESSRGVAADQERREQGGTHG